VRWVAFARFLAVEISDREFESGSRKDVYNVQIVLSRISTVMPWIIPFPAIDVNGDFPDSVLFFGLWIIGLLFRPI